MNKRPIAITILGWLFVAFGVVLFAYHLKQVDLHRLFRSADNLIPLAELIWTVAGAFMLRGHSWARWLLLAWIAFHVALSYPSFHATLVHGLLLALIAWLLFRADARAYFRHAESASE
jgi:hypothetical protein